MTAGSAESVESRRSAADLSRRCRSAALFAVIFLGGLLAGPWPFAVLVAVISLLAAIELRRLLVALGWERGTVLLLLSPLATWLFLLRAPVGSLGPGVLAVWIAAVGWMIRPVAPALASAEERVPGSGLTERQRMRAWSALAVFLGLLYVALLPSFLIRLHAGPWSGAAGPEVGWGWAAFCVFVVWAADSGAYAVGILWGRRLLWPAVSPKKTWEGALGGLACAILVAVLLAGPLRVGIGFAGALGAGLLIGMAAPIGDLFESRLKRAAGLKDSGHLIPGHGGILDRFDSLFLSAPLFYYYLHGVAGRF